jgi:tetratricopeptide (TPR) repeat protein
MAEAFDHPHSLIVACHDIGRVYLHKGVLHRAIPCLERALDLCRDWDIPRLLYLVSSTLGYAYVLAGRASDALPLLEQSVATAAMANMQGRIHIWLSEAYLRLGRLDEALAGAMRSLELCRVQAQQGELAWTLRLLGEIHAHCQPSASEPSEAAYREALSLAEELGMRPLQAHCQRGLGTLYARQGQRQQARAALATAIDLYRDMEMTFWLPQTEEALARVV